jgi:hypothetical protein
MKIICVGFHKTGTSTLDEALKILGYKVIGLRLDLAKYLLNGDYSKALKIADKYDAFQDNPWPILYKELDKKYPNSKFILTIREDQKWLKSIVNHFGGDNTGMRKWIYGESDPKGNEELYLKRYQKHNQDVIEYFKDRKEDLIIVSWEKGDGWNEICTFLGKQIPNQDFPHSNKGNYNKKPNIKDKIILSLKKFKKLYLPFLSKR